MKFLKKTDIFPAFFFKSSLIFHGFLELELNLFKFSKLFQLFSSVCFKFVEVFLWNFHQFLHSVNFSTIYIKSCQNFPRFSPISFHFLSHSHHNFSLANQIPFSCQFSPLSSLELLRQFSPQSSCACAINFNS